MNKFLEAIENRRTIYSISNEIKITDEYLKEIVEVSVNHSPSAFNSQTSRVVLLLEDSHQKLWDIVLNTLRAIVPADRFAETETKIASFSAGYGTILYFEEQDTIKNLQENFRSYAENFPIWSQQASGMLQLVVWTALETEGIGASIQHYNPLIDDEVSKIFDIPKSWKLISQMPIGNITEPAGEKSFLPIATRVKVLRKVK